MRFDGERLLSILENQVHPVQVRDHCGRLEGVYQDARRAISILLLGKYYGVGSRTRIRFIQAETADDRVIPWGTNLELGALTRAHGQRISRKAMVKNRLTWEQRPEKSRTGITGNVGQVWLPEDGTAKAVEPS
jgi:hypothetical protein